MKRRNLRIRTTWLCIMLAIIIFLCGLFLLFTLQINRMIRNREENENLSDAANVKTILDDTWSNVLNHCLPLANSSIAGQLESAQTFEDFQALSAYTLYMDIRNAVAFDPMLEDITLYYPATDHIVGKWGVKSSSAYWALTYGVDSGLPVGWWEAQDPAQVVNPAVSFERWCNELYIYGGSGYFIVPTEGGCELYYRYCLGSQDDRILLVRVSKSAVADRLFWVQGGGSESFAAVIADPDTVYSASGSWDGAMQDDSRMYTRLSSSVSGLSYLLINKKSNVYQLSSTTVAFALVLLACAVIFSTLLAVWLVRQHITPLEKIAERLSPTETERQGNELAIINDAVENLLQEQGFLTMLSRQQQMIISRAFMYGLLLGDPQKNPEEVAATYGIALRGSHYCIVAAKAVDSEEPVISLLLAYSGNANIHWMRHSNIDVFLLNFDVEDLQLPELWRQQLQAMGAGRIAVSKIIDTPLALSECWAQVIRELGCLHLLPNAYQQKNLYAGVSPVLEQFHIHLTAGEFFAARQLAGELYDNYINDKDPFYFEYKNYRLIHLLLPVCPTPAQAALAQLPRLRDREQWLSCLSGILEDCIRLTQSAKQDFDSDVAGKIRSIILRQYSNPMLDLHMIATQMHLSQSYISRMFKQKYGTSVAQYINYIRIEKAKELILSGNESVKAIAAMVGFAGDAQFIRAFKRQEDMTPGSFRAKNPN